MEKDFQIGQIVRFTGKFLRSAGMLAGAPINGRVESFSEGLGFPLVLWNDRDEAVPVNPANLELCPYAKALNRFMRMK